MKQAERRAEVPAEGMQLRVGQAEGQLLQLVARDNVCDPREYCTWVTASMWSNRRFGRRLALGAAPGLNCGAQLGPSPALHSPEGRVSLRREYRTDEAAEGGAEERRAVRAAARLGGWVGGCTDIGG